MIATKHRTKRSIVKGWHGESAMLDREWDERMSDSNQDCAITTTRGFLIRMRADEVIVDRRAGDDNE